MFLDAVACDEVLIAVYAVLRLNLNSSGVARHARLSLPMSNARFRSKHPNGFAGDKGTETPALACQPRMSGHFGVVFEQCRTMAGTLMEVLTW